MASTAAIEVERKFAASDPSALRQRVEANGGQVLGEKAFNDQYWDNAQCTLTRRDTWLRRRQDQWELKVPIVGSRRSGGETTSFREIEGEPEPQACDAAHPAAGPEHAPRRASRTPARSV